MSTLTDKIQRRPGLRPYCPPISKDNPHTTHTRVEWIDKNGQVVEVDEDAPSSYPE